MGHILTAEDVHSLFIASLQSIIDNKIDSSAALASLKTPQLKAIYGKVKQREQELKGIANGTLSPGAVKNL
ncbi:MAG TPA: hypothetical protein VF629_10195 [Hymenobacter sp.]|uniref:hypothetical protein n=1 Tax=Hymenobacter sp. TaxID=1898978 RepID=UPI002ED7B765